MTELTPAASSKLNSLGTELIGKFGESLDFKRMGEVGKLGDVISTKMDPKSREALILAVNKDPDGFVAAARQKILQNPTLLDQVSNDPNSLGKILGVASAAPSAPAAFAAAATPVPAASAAQAVAASTQHASTAVAATAPTLARPFTAAAAPAASTASSADPITDIAASLDPAQKKDFAGFLQRVSSNKDLEGAMEQLQTGNDPAKKNDFIATIKDAAKKDPKFFENLNDMMDQHPAMVSNMAGRFVDDPKGTMNQVKEFQQLDHFRGELASWLGGLGSFGVMLGNLLNKVFNAVIESPMAPMLAGMAAPFMDKMQGLQNSGTVQSVNNGQTLVPPGGPTVKDAKTGQTITAPAATPDTVLSRKNPTPAAAPAA